MFGSICHRNVGKLKRFMILRLALRGSVDLSLSTVGMLSYNSPAGGELVIGGFCVVLFDVIVYIST